MLYSSLGFLGSAGMIHAELTLQVQCLNTEPDLSCQCWEPAGSWFHLGSGGCSQLVPGDLCPGSGMLEAVKPFTDLLVVPFPRRVLQPVSLEGKLLLETLIQLLELAVALDCPHQQGKCDNISPCEITAHGAE